MRVCGIELSIARNMTTGLVAAGLLFMAAPANAAAAMDGISGAIGCGVERAEIAYEKMTPVRAESRICMGDVSVGHWAILRSRP